MWKFLDTFLYGLEFVCFYIFSGCHKKNSDTFEHHRTTKRLREHEYRLHSETFSGKKVVHPMEIPVISATNRTKEVFELMSRGRTWPVVLQNFALSEQTSKWNAEYFSSGVVGATPVITLDPGTFKGEFTSFAQAIPVKTIDLKTNIQQMLAGSGQYINNVTSLFVDQPQLVEDLDLSRLREINDDVNETSWLKLNFFIGARGTKSSLHCAAAGNYFHCIRGKKKWTFVHPKFSPSLRAIPSANFAFVISNLSEIPPEVPTFEVVLEPGDVLYSPPWWWHKVENVDDFTIGVAVRDHTAYWQSWRNNPLFMACSPYWYKLHPVALSALKTLFGRVFLLDTSMKSGKFINKCISG